MSQSERALDLTLDALAVYRLTRLVTVETITEPLRERVFDHFGPPETSRGVSFMVTCKFCVSVWMGGGVVLARIVFPKAWSITARGLALSAVTSLIAERE
jgi:hypothetical protein